MRLVPGTRYYRCGMCSREFIALLDCLPCRPGFLTLTVGLILVLAAECAILGRSGVQQLVIDLTRCTR